MMHDVLFFVFGWVGVEGVGGGGRGRGERIEHFTLSISL